MTRPRLLIDTLPLEAPAYAWSLAGFQLYSLALWKGQGR